MQHRNTRGRGGWSGWWTPCLQLAACFALPLQARAEPALAATLLPAARGADRSQLAPSWPGPDGARLTAVAETFAAGSFATLQLPLPGPLMIERLVEAKAGADSDCRATRVAGFRVERFNDGRGGRLRLVSIDASGREAAGAWEPVPIDSDLMLALLEPTADAGDAPAQLLHATGAGLDRQLPLHAPAPAYRLRGSVPIQLSGRQP